MVLENLNCKSNQMGIVWQNTGQGFCGIQIFNLLNREAAREKDFEILVKLNNYDNSEYIIKRTKS